MKYFRFSIFDFRLMGSAVALLTLLLSGCGRADEAGSGVFYDVQVSASTNAITVGDLVRVRMAVAHPATARVEWPDTDDHAITIRDRRTERVAVDDKTTRTVQQYTITSFQRGEHTWATGTVRFVTADGETEERELPGLPLQVVSLIEDDEDAALAPIKPLLDWPGRIPRWMAVFLAIALLAVVLGLIAARWMTRRRTILQQPPPPPAHETALNALRLLRHKGYIEQNDVAPFYMELSAIVRRYLEDRFSLRAPESTTEEFIRDAANARVLSTSHQSLVNGFLEQSDLVKFAKFRPGAPEMQDAFHAAENLVQETIPAPPAVEAAS